MRKPLPGLRIAQVAPPMERVPPERYGGTERVVHELVLELLRRGHDVTTFATGDSDVPGRLVVTAPRALRPSGYEGDPGPWFVQTQLEVLARAGDFDVVHSHLEWTSLLLARSTSVPVVSTFHGRLDFDYAIRLLADPPPGLVAVSRSQASAHPDVPFVVVPNGLTLRDAPFERRRGDDLCFVGRVAPEKGVVEAIEVARRSGRRLVIAAKIGTTGPEREYAEAVFRPALAAAGSLVEFIGEVDRTTRDAIVARSWASLMPGSWPEPFGLVAIESLACGTPVVARRVGALPEIVREGIDGFFGDDVQHLAFLLDRVRELDRLAIRQSVLERFSAARMTDRYEALYGELLAIREERARRILRPARLTGDGGRESTAAVVEVAARELAGRITSHPEAASPERAEPRATG
ncbi:MAG TPA: glycosyltransferase family 4 protein [Candidatus Limnocylindrales bacterium]|nr:glycosyltransferase family 4 protein [Candidatus Limnocylindrales bacterium]